MLEYLIQLPCDYLGQNVLEFLGLIDIIQLENAVTSHKSQKLLISILPYCPPIMLSDSFNQLKLKDDALNWFIKRLCRIQFVKIDLAILCKVNFEHSIMNNIELFLNQYASLNHVLSLQNQKIHEKVFHVKIKSDQDPAVMEVLFSLFSSVRSLDIDTVNIFQWMEHIRKIGPCLRDLILRGVAPQLTLKTITEYCPYLDKLNLCTLADFSQLSNILQSIANNCPHLRSLDIYLSYYSSAEADAGQTAFAEKCPQLEELSLNCPQFTDQSMIALAQHCSRLKKLKLCSCKFTASSLIALSERGLPLEELDVFPMIPIPSAEIAAQCVYAFSRIRELKSNCFYNPRNGFLHAIQYMTGLRCIELDSSYDHLLVPHLLLLLQGQCCAGLESLTISLISSITPEQLGIILTGCYELHALQIRKPTCTSDAVLGKLTYSCLHLQKVTLDSSGKLTEEGVLGLAAHCRQLQEIDLGRTTVTEETVRQLAQHCRRLTRLSVNVNVREGEVMVERCKQYSSKEIRALRE